jgi:hypothetical protein
MPVMSQMHGVIEKDVITDTKGKKIKEIDFDGNQIWPRGPKTRINCEV